MPAATAGKASACAPVGKLQVWPLTERMAANLWLLRSRIPTDTIDNGLLIPCALTEEVSYYTVGVDQV